MWSSCRTCRGLRAWLWAAALDTGCDASLWLRQPERKELSRMTRKSHTMAVLTDSHFLIPAVVFLAGITLLIVMH